MIYTKFPEMPEVTTQTARVIIKELISAYPYIETWHFVCHAISKGQGQPTHVDYFESILIINQMLGVHTVIDWAEANNVEIRLNDNITYRKQWVQHMLTELKGQL